MASSRKLRVGVIFGGRSGEHAVSLMSARSVLAAIDSTRYTVTEIGIARTGAWYVGEAVLEALEAENTRDLVPATLLPDPSRPGLREIAEGATDAVKEGLGELDVIFPVLHGTFGEDGTLQGLFELAGVAYVGAGVLASAVGMDKGLFKDVMRANGIPVLESLILRRDEIEADLDTALDRAEEVADYPLFTKPANLGSSVGVSKCRQRSDLMEGLMEAAQFDRRVLVERGLVAREIEVSVLGNAAPRASVPGEIVPAAEFYTYQAKYHDHRSELLIPAPLEPQMASRVQDLAVRAFRAIDGAGLARVDFLLDRPTGELYLNEVNTMPGFTEISMYPKLWAASGLAYQDLVDELISLALARRDERDRTTYSYDREA